ncbi:MAG: iron-sulfur cluster assembly scaffold protein [Deltaproteobacteria bacterium]|nr:iron-sulfur cluster assembly scaffold protein [Deltaproteobacteria bacterium]
MARSTEERPADGYGSNTGMCGDTVVMSLFVSGGRITRASFRVDGCATTLACAAAAARFAEGKTVQEAWEIDPAYILDLVGPLPPESEHCAELAVGALYLALSDYRENRRSPWKKLYRKE